MRTISRTAQVSTTRLGYPKGLVALSTTDACGATGRRLEGCRRFAGRRDQDGGMILGYEIGEAKGG
jgi:hypothetical protein